MKYIWILLLCAVACTPTFDEFKKELTIVRDTITTTDTIPQNIDTVASTQGGIYISFNEDTCIIASDTYNATKIGDYTTLHLEKQGNKITKLLLDGTILYGKKDASKDVPKTSKPYVGPVKSFVVNHNYVYVESHTLIVQRGNTLESIAEDHGTTVEALLTKNPTLNHHVKVGQRIRLD